MLYYVKIGPYKGVDYSEGQDYAGRVELRLGLYLLPLSLQSLGKLPLREEHMQRLLPLYAVRKAKL